MRGSPAVTGPKRTTHPCRALHENEARPLNVFNEALGDGP